MKQHNLAIKCGSQILDNMLIWGARCGHRHPNCHYDMTRKRRHKSSARERPNTKNVQRRHRAQFLSYGRALLDAVGQPWSRPQTLHAHVTTHGLATAATVPMCCAMSHHCNRNVSHPSPFTLERSRGKCVFLCGCPCAIDALATPHVSTPQSMLCVIGKKNVLFSPWTLVGRTAKRHNVTKQRKSLFARTCCR